MPTRAHSHRLNSFFRHKYKEIIPEESRHSPMEVRPKKDTESTEYFATTYNVTLHYLDRYIERIFDSNPEDYTNKDKERLAEMLQSILPIADGLSTTYTKDGITSIIREGIAITAYPEGTKNEQT